MQSVPWAVSVHDTPSLVLGNVGEGSSVDGCSELEGGDDNRDWLLLLLVSLLKTGDWLLPVLWIGLEVQSSPGCFFWMSAKHLEQRFMVLLDPQNPQGHRGGRLGGLLRSLVSPMTSNTKTPRYGNARPGMSPRPGRSMKGKKNRSNGQVRQKIKMSSLL